MRPKSAVLLIFIGSSDYIKDVDCPQIIHLILLEKFEASKLLS